MITCCFLVLLLVLSHILIVFTYNFVYIKLCFVPIYSSAMFLHIALWWLVPGVLVA